MGDVQPITENDLLENQEDETENVTEDQTEILEEEEEDLTDSADNFFSVWDDRVEVKRLKVLLYGLSGMGKTTMAATFPKPLFLDLEGGMLSVRKFKPLRFPANPSESVRSYPQVVEFYQYVANAVNPPFQTIVIDSLNELQSLITQYVVTKFTGIKRQYSDQMTLADYGKANRDVSKVVRLFLNLPYNIVFTAASTQKEIGDEADTMITPKFVGRQVGPDVQKMMDMIGYCYAKEMPDKSNQHYVSFHMTTKYLAKDRLGIVKRDIPNSYESLIHSTKGAE
jgi:hypothetical protein